MLKPTKSNSASKGMNMKRSSTLLFALLLAVVSVIFTTNVQAQVTCLPINDSSTVWPDGDFTEYCNGDQSTGELMLTACVFRRNRIKIPTQIE
jgi:hypothetical protein